MAKQDRKPVRPDPRPRQSGALFTGAIFLALGLLIGYYFGRLSSRSLPQEGAGQTAASPASPVGSLQAEAGLLAALNARPNDLPTLIQLGNLYYDAGRFHDAIDYYGRALQLDPRNVDVRTDRGTCYWNIGQADPAIAEFLRSLEVNPTHPQTLYNLGVVYLHGKNDPAGAKAVWEKLLAANPDYPERAKVQDMIASLGGSATPPAKTGAATGEGARFQGVEELLERMKKR
jgi:cytochrome c-type biogenesis protein CcmH/NrfG